MGFFDRFKSDTSDGFRDIEKLDPSKDFETLMDIANHDKNPDRGIAAMMKIYNKEKDEIWGPMSVAVIAVNSTNQRVALAAVDQLNDREYLLNVVEHTKDPEVKKRAFSKLR